MAAVLSILITTETGYSLQVLTRNPEARGPGIGLRTPR